MRKIRTIFVLLAVLLLTGCTKESTEMQGKHEVAVVKELDKVVIEEVSPSKDTVSVPMYINQGFMYTVSLPSSSNYETDNFTYIKDKDGMWNILLVTVDSVTDLSNLIPGIKTESISQTVIRSIQGVKGKKFAVKYLGEGRAYVMSSYDADVFATVLDEFESGVTESCEDYSVRIVDYKEGIKQYTTYVSNISDFNEDNVVINVNHDAYSSEDYSFDDGCLTYANELKQFDDAVDIMKKKLGIVTNNAILELVFETNSVFYAEYGDYTICVVKENFNTSHCLWGVGETAKDNIKAFVAGQ